MAPVAILSRNRACSFTILRLPRLVRKPLDVRAQRYPFPKGQAVAHLGIITALEPIPSLERSALYKALKAIPDHLGVDVLFEKFRQREDRLVGQAVGRFGY